MEADRFFYEMQADITILFVAQAACRVLMLRSAVISGGVSGRKDGVSRQHDIGE